MKKLLFLAGMLTIGAIYSCQKDGISSVDSGLSNWAVTERGDSLGHHCDSLHLDTLPHHPHHFHADSTWHPHADSTWHPHPDSTWHPPHDTTGTHNGPHGGGGHGGHGGHGGGH